MRADLKKHLVCWWIIGLLSGAVVSMILAGSGCCTVGEAALGAWDGARRDIHHAVDAMQHQGQADDAKVVKDAEKAGGR